ncbi:MAG: polysaccharide deacetylase family protein [Paludibacteraceae bacterium]|nr:polysaccharide deacetylase family protein [Paludibacteraceae bacterium]MBQ6983997.1 polysaccharide deacetylase family protein [Paludibacteraceae bacterium]
MIDKLLHKIKRKWLKMRFQPIRVYCLHHVCAEFDAESMNRGDWMDINEFKQKVSAMRQNGIAFISLSDAYSQMTNDKFRNRKYAVLTFDDGYASLKEILPWLEEHKIPVTLFINGKYLDGKSYRKSPKEKYLTNDELDQLSKQNPFLTIGSHGWEHVYATDMTNDEFVASAEKNVALLSSHPRYIPFWAYAYGDHTQFSDTYLRNQHIVPIYIDGMKNYNEPNVIHRELL